MASSSVGGPVGSASGDSPLKIKGSPTNSVTRFDDAEPKQVGLPDLRLELVDSQEGEIAHIAPLRKLRAPNCGQPKEQQTSSAIRDRFRFKQKLQLDTITEEHSAMDGGNGEQPSDDPSADTPRY
jgi:hypothetical protein